MSQAWQVMLVLCLAAACAQDLATLRLPNWICIVVACGALARALDVAHPAVAVGWALASAAAGATPLLAAYARGLLGAGDVKYFFALCLHLQPHGAIRALLAASLVGGAAAIFTVSQAFAAQPGQWPWRELRLPYGVALSAGFAWSVWGG